ncbi:two pore domain potassium channel family protein [Bacillus aerolatus]|uniref:Two pore domain potassium channel family protein n=1 Tax=Bacillus aerolatus TaxID=2653354 RepID=A0A6I1FF75_9BACI|nr:potassium channel family protein [Bacillus aerolatus]KAB7704124.1 two pore domain potassium channel family protein [Bacillus aerolatus]
MTAMIFSAVVFCLTMSMKGMFVPGQPRHRYLSLHYFLYFGCLYLTMMIGFALIYMLLQINGHAVWAGEGDSYLSFWDRFFTSLYFSGITLFSVGYGDIVPEGAGRWVALVEAWAGYTIPTAFVVRTMLEKEAG